MKKVVFCLDVDCDDTKVVSYDDDVEDEEIDDDLASWVDSHHVQLDGHWDPVC